MIHINLDREDKLSLSRQIYRSIKNGILTGKIKSGTKLPSSRELSSELHVARNVVVDCYEQLIAEGYAYTKNGSGTYISDGVVLPRKDKETAVIKTEVVSPKPEIKVSFRTGIPDLSLIPINKWAQLYHKSAIGISPSEMDYQDPMGNEVLRATLARYLNRVRGTDANPQNIIITNGAAQSFNLICKLLSTKDYALVENPLSHGLLHTLESNNVKLSAIRLDSDGMVTKELPKSAPKLIFTTPSHQFPMGSILTASRRIELINYVASNDAYIVEDDYDSEFRFDGNPIESMQNLAPERVIYVGTFSKTLMPALRIGYMVLPDKLTRQLREAKYVADIHSPVLEQLTLSSFIESGSFERHLRNMQKLYHRKRDLLIKTLKKYFGDSVEIFGAAAGLHFVAAFSGVKFDATLLEKIRDGGIEISAVSKHLYKEGCSENYDNLLIFGYGNTAVDKIESGINTLYKIIKGEKQDEN